ncbi:YdcF family protein [Corynebacterium kutscheri]|uniref:YdcF family protein n=1 Tax=Corynebacterium kutscheri TaxID=35755 RepID=UPI0037C073A1
MHIVVLGAKVHATRPSSLLAQRLEVAARLASPTDTIVVSGKGEAEIMRAFLIDLGIDAQQIIVENAATSTNENLENTAQLAPPGTYWLVVTNSFHVWRTRLWIWHLGFPGKVIGSGLFPLRKAGIYGLIREFFALPHSAVRIAFRRFLHLNKIR